MAADRPGLVRYQAEPSSSQSSVGIRESLVHRRLTKLTWTEASIRSMASAQPAIEEKELGKSLCDMEFDFNEEGEGGDEKEEDASQKKAGRSNDVVNEEDDEEYHHERQIAPQEDDSDDTDTERDDLLSPLRSTEGKPKVNARSSDFSAASLGGMFEFSQAAGIYLTDDSENNSTSSFDKLYDEVSVESMYTVKKEKEDRNVEEEEVIGEKVVVLEQEEDDDAEEEVGDEYDLDHIEQLRDAVLEDLCHHENDDRPKEDRKSYYKRISSFGSQEDKSQVVSSSHDSAHNPELQKRNRIRESIQSISLRGNLMLQTEPSIHNIGLAESIDKEDLHGSVSESSSAHVAKSGDIKESSSNNEDETGDCASTYLAHLLSNESRTVQMLALKKLSILTSAVMGQNNRELALHASKIIVFGGNSFEDQELQKAFLKLLVASAHNSKDAGSDLHPWSIYFPMRSCSDFLDVMKESEKEMAEDERNKQSDEESTTIREYIESLHVPALEIFTQSLKNVFMSQLELSTSGLKPIIDYHDSKFARVLRTMICNIERYEGRLRAAGQSLKCLDLLRMFDAEWSRSTLCFALKPILLKVMDKADEILEEEPTVVMEATKMLGGWEVFV